MSSLERGGRSARCRREEDREGHGGERFSPLHGVGSDDVDEGAALLVLVGPVRALRLRLHLPQETAQELLVLLVEVHPLLRDLLVAKLVGGEGAPALRDRGASRRQQGGDPSGAQAPRDAHGGHAFPVCLLFVPRVSSRAFLSRELVLSLSLSSDTNLVVALIRNALNAFST